MIETILQNQKMVALIATKTNNVSQMYYAKKGIITKEMQFISERENCNLENFLKTLTKEQLQKSIISIKVISILKFLKNTLQNLLEMK